MKDRIERLRQCIFAARGEAPADLVLRGGSVVNVFSGRTENVDVAVHDGVIVGLGAGYQGREERDITGRWLIPGLIEGHLHIESSMLMPDALAEAILPHGTTALVADPHEIANVKGLEGIRMMLAESERIPLDIFFMAPSCVPATHLETSGASLGPHELSSLLDEPRILGLAEMMNFPGVLMGDEEVLQKIDLFHERILDGHSPGLTGKELSAYLTTGIGSDHEAYMLEEGREKVARGMMLMIREGTSAKNLETLLPLVDDRNWDRFCFVSDDLHAEDIAQRGHLDHMLRKAVRSGLDPVRAVQLASINTARYFGLGSRGAVAPGYRADLVVLEDLRDFRALSVYKDGRLVARDGRALPFSAAGAAARLRMPAEPLRVADFTPQDLAIPHPGGHALVIGLIPGQLVTQKLLKSVPAEGGFVRADSGADILKLCVVERHNATGRIGIGLVQGFGLQQGALASSIAHDSHNIIAVGVDDVSIHQAVMRLKELGGGMAAVAGGHLLAEVPLEVGGLMTRAPFEDLVRHIRALKAAARELGASDDEPFMQLSFLGLPVIPELKLTDQGLVDVTRFDFVNLFP